MIMAGIHVKQVETDADTLIVSTTLTTGVSEELAIVVVGTETDLRVKVVDRATSSIAMCMLCRNSPTTLYNTWNSVCYRRHNQTLDISTCRDRLWYCVCNISSEHAQSFQCPKNHTPRTMICWSRSQRPEACLMRWKVQEKNIFSDCIGSATLNPLMNTATLHTIWQLVERP